MHKLRRKGNLEGMLKAATYTDLVMERGGRLIDAGASVRVAALEALVEYHGMAARDVPEVVSALGEALRDNSQEVRQGAVEGLAAVASGEALGQLIDLLASGEEEDPVIRGVALDAVCQSGLPGSTERWAHAVLESRTLPLDERAREEFTTLKAGDAEVDPGQRVFDVLAPIMASPQAKPGELAVGRTVLGWCVPASFAGLEGMLSSYTVSLPLIELAGQTGDQALVDPLSRFLDHADPEVRRHAADALGAMCDTRAVLPLLKAARDSDVRVRKASVAALQSLGSAGVTTAMALLAQANREEAMAGGADPALEGHTWTRTLGRLMERSGLRNISRRRGRGGERNAELHAARDQYEALLARNPEPSEAPEG